MPSHFEWLIIVVSAVFHPGAPKKGLTLIGASPGWCRAPAVLDLHQWATLQDLFVSRFT
jgi:hypothetical protein